MSAITLNELDIFYGDTQITDNISFDIKQGESFALVGESGSGKSTILKAIMGLAPKWTGSIKINDVARSHGVDFGLATQCQMVFQDPYGSLHPRKTVDATLSEPLTIHRISDQNERIEQVMQSVGLDLSFRFRYPHQLSGGQRQRVVIARALMLEPKILLLDEPTSALDVSVQAEILNLFKKLRKERGLTYLLVTHNLPVVSFLCDRLAVIKAGKLVEVTAVEQLREGNFKHAYTQELYAASGGEIS